MTYWQELRPYGNHVYLALKDCKWGYLVFQRKRLERKVCYHDDKIVIVILFFFVMYIAGAKFEDHCFNISGDILDSVFYYLCGTMQNEITFLVCIIEKREYLENEKRYFKKENAIRLDSENPFKKAAIIFLLYRHLKLSGQWRYRFIRSIFNKRGLIYHVSRIRLLNLPLRYIKAGYHVIATFTVVRPLQNNLGGLYDSSLDMITRMKYA